MIVSNKIKSSIQRVERDFLREKSQNKKKNHWTKSDKLIYYAKYKLQLTKPT